MAFAKCIIFVIGGISPLQTYANVKTLIGAILSGFFYYDTQKCLEEILTSEGVRLARNHSNYKLKDQGKPAQQEYSCGTYCRRQAMFINLTTCAKRHIFTEITSALIPINRIILRRGLLIKSTVEYKEIG